MMQGEVDTALPIDQPVHRGVPVSGATRARLTLVVNGCTHTAHLAARENPDSVSAELAAFLATLPAAAGEEQR
jgi:hypothetical protein